tara:strand:- start:888 stop:1127 length:240 start_codon:yes stop_codon:yes gene_type:complete
MCKKINKTNEVRKHLLRNKTITSLQAFKMWNATRLSGIIYTLRHREMMDIESVDTKINGTVFSKYTYRGIKDESNRKSK